MNMRAQVIITEATNGWYVCVECTNGDIVVFNTVFEVLADAVSYAEGLLL